MFTIEGCRVGGLGVGLSAGGWVEGLGFGRPARSEGRLCPRLQSPVGWFGVAGKLLATYYEVTNLLSSP